MCCAGLETLFAYQTESEFMNMYRTHNRHTTENNEHNIIQHRVILNVLFNPFK